MPLTLRTKVYLKFLKGEPFHKIAQRYDVSHRQISSITSMQINNRLLHTEILPKITNKQKKHPHYEILSEKHYLELSYNDVIKDLTPEELKEYEKSYKILPFHY